MTLSTNEIPVGMQLKLISGVGNPPRPKIYDAAVTTIYIDKLLPKILDWLYDSDNTKDPEFTDDYLTQLKSDLTEATDHSSDGYEITRYLERHCHWACDSALVEILEVSVTLRMATHNCIVAQWVLNNGIIPEYSVGQQVTFVQRDKSLVGEITNVDIRCARYIIYCKELGHVKSPKSGRTGTFVGVEDVVGVIV